MKVVVPQVNIELLSDIAQCVESISRSGDQDITAIAWNPQIKPTLDMFDEVQPNILFIHPSMIDHSFAVACQEFNFKYVVVGDSWIRDANGSFVQLPRNPALVMTSPKTLHQFPSDMQKIAPKNGARVAQIHGAKFSPDFESDVLVITSGLENSRELEIACRFLCSKYRTKIVGSTPIQCHNYIGQVNMFERASFIKSTKFLVDFSGRHCWDAQYLKTAPLCGQRTNSVVLHFGDLLELDRTISSLLGNEMSYDQYVKSCFEDACNGNTFFHITSEIFQRINEPETAESLKGFIEELINDRNT